MGKYEITFTFQFNLRVAWPVTDTNPAPSTFNWLKQCRVINARTGTGITKSTSDLTEILDFGNTYQTGDVLMAICNLDQSGISRSITQLATVTGSDTMGSADKVLILTFTPILVKLKVQPTITPTNPSPATQTWTKRCTALITRQSITLDTITIDVPSSQTTLDFGRKFLKDDSVAVTCNIMQKTGTNTAVAISQARVATAVSFTNTADETVSVTYGTFLVSSV